VTSAVWSEFEDIDAAADADGYVDYLDQLRSLGDTAEYKALSYQRLGLGPGGTASGARILDVGSGAGHDCIEMARLGGTGVSVTGVDPSAQLLEVSRRRAAEARVDVRFEQGSAYQLPFDDDAFSACRSDRVFLYLDRPGDALTEMHRVAEPGGLLWVRDPDMTTLLLDADGLDPATTRTISDFFSDGFPNGWSGRRLDRLLRQQGIGDATVVPRTLISRSLKEADTLFAIRRNAVASAAAGAVDRSDVDRWLAALAAADAEGLFSFSLTFFEAFGHIP
jgi:ubiquinone/menaquinone biosynthesis C-methylase UbiE